MELRNYQRAALEGIIDYLAEDSGSRPLVDMPTGSGKSIVLTRLAHLYAIASDNNRKIYIITHRAELIRQSYKLIGGNPDVPVTVYGNALKDKDLSGKIVMGMVQSLCRCDTLPPADMIIVDEAHLVPPVLGKSGKDGQYRKVLDLLLEPGVPVIGFTATPYRLGQGMLTEGNAAVFDGFAYRAAMPDLIQGNYLVPPTTFVGKAGYDSDSISRLAKVRRNSDGEFAIGEQDKVLLEDTAVHIVDELVEKYKRSRNRWIVFTPGVHGAELMADLLQGRGVNARCIIGKTPEHEREDIYRQFRDPDGDVTCITGCDVLTTGFDAPITDLIVLARATESPGLYVQIIGRGMRPFDGKDDCLVVDYGGNALRHGPVNNVYVKKPDERRSKKRPAMGKVCQECGAYTEHKATKHCHNCGAEFPARKTYVSTEAGVELVYDPDHIQLTEIECDVLKAGWETFTAMTTGKGYLRMWAEVPWTEELRIFMKGKKQTKFTKLEGTDSSKWPARLHQLRNKKPPFGNVDDQDIYALEKDSVTWMRPTSVILKRSPNGKWVNIYAGRGWHTD